MNGLALAVATIRSGMDINRANDVQLSPGNIADLLDFLSKPHTNPDLAKATKEVLEQRNRSIIGRRSPEVT